MDRGRINPLSKKIEGPDREKLCGQYTSTSTLGRKFMIYIDHAKLMNTVNKQLLSELANQWTKKIESSIILKRNVPVHRRRNTIKIK